MNADEIETKEEGVVRKGINLVSSVFLFAWNIRLGPVLAYGITLLVLALMFWSAWMFFHDPGGRDFNVADGVIDTIEEPNVESRFELFRTELDSMKAPFGLLPKSCSM